MSTTKTLIDSSNDLAEMAAECGIDWYQISDLRVGHHKHPPTISNKYKNKCSMWVDEKPSSSGGTLIRVTFHTNKHGGISRSWSGYERPLFSPRNVSTNIRRTPDETPSEQNERRKRICRAYKQAYLGAPNAVSSGYLADKGILDILNVFNMRVLTDANVLGKGGAANPFICFHLQNRNEEYVGLQRIYENGTKKLTSGMGQGYYKGAHSVIGDVKGATTIYITEGFATGASIHLATRQPVIFAYSAGNLSAVAHHIKAKYEGINVMLAADNDVGLNGNTGLYKALEAAKEAKLPLVFPPSFDGEKCDFNDIHRAYGLDFLKDVLKNPLNVIKPEKNYADYLFQLLKYAKRQEIPKLVKSLAVVTKVPHFLNESELFQRIKDSVGERVQGSVISKNIRAVIVAGTFRAKAISGISDQNIEKRLQLSTLQNQQGHWVISEDSVARILDELSLGHCVILKAPMGTGKTELVVKAAMDRVIRAAHVLPRVSIVDDAAKRLSLDHYQKVDEVYVHFTDKIATCINSMGASRFESEGFNWFENLDLLCLDEASQVFSQITQLGKASRKKQNYEAFSKSISSAQALLVTDADANDFLIGEIRRINPSRKITLVEVSHPKDAKKSWDIKLTDSDKNVQNEILDSVLKGSRCLLATDSKSLAQRMERLILLHKPDAKILNIHREPSREGLIKVSAFYQNPNEECLKYDVMIYSPAITSGVSITTPHFQRHFGIFSGIVKVNDLIQMMGRDRTSEKWMLALTPKTWNQEHSRHQASLESIGETATLYSDLKYSTERYELDSRENLSVLAINILKMKGHRITMLKELQDKMDDSLKSILKSISADLSKERLHRILGQAEISESEYLSLAHKWLPDEEEAAAMYAYKIRNYLCSDLTEANIKFMDNGGLKKVALFETFLSEERHLARFDNDQKKSHDPSDRYYANEKNQTINQTLKLLGISREDLSGEFTSAQCQSVVDYFALNTDKMNLLFQGIIDGERPPKCATSFVKKFLALLGLDIGKRKSEGRMIRFVDSKSVDRMLGYAQRRYENGQTFIEQGFSLKAA